MLDGFQQFALLLPIRVKPSDDVAVRNDENVPRRSWKTIPDCFDQFGFVQYTVL